MAKKKKHPEHENLERWLVSYADFITLLFATFTALYALAQADLSKMKDVSAAIKQGFQEQSIIQGVKSILEGKGASSDNPNPISSDKGAGQGVLEYESMTYTAGEVRDVEKTVQQLKNDLGNINKDIAQIETPKPDAQAKEGADVPMRGVEVSVQERGLKVSFDSRVLFEPGTATLRQDSLKYLDTITQRLKKYDSTHVIHVEGHTDDQPISSAIFPSNWELSAARSGSVVRHLINRQGFNPQSLVVVGYGSSQPITTNITAEGRTKNRRVDIIIYSQRVSNLINPRTQYAGEEKLIKAEERNKDNEVIKTGSMLSKPQIGPVKVIIKEKDGSERVLTPKATVVPNLQPDYGHLPAKSSESKSAPH